MGAALSGRMRDEGARTGAWPCHRYLLSGLSLFEPHANEGCGGIDEEVGDIGSNGRRRRSFIRDVGFLGWESVCDLG